MNDLKKDIEKKPTADYRKPRTNCRIGLLSGIASAVVVFGLVMTISTPVRAFVMAPVKKMISSVFHFIPGEGIVKDNYEEVIAQGFEGTISTDEKGNSEKVYYILDNVGEKSFNEDIAIELVSATFHKSELTVKYNVDLLKVDFDEFSKVMEDALMASDSDLIDEKYLQVYLDYYKKLGYDKYFKLGTDIEDSYEAVKEPISEVTFEGKPLKRLSAKTLFSEDASGRYPQVTEKYSFIGVETFDNGDLEDGIVLSIGGVEIPVRLKLSEEYRTKEDLLGEYNSGSFCSGIEFIADASRSGDKLKLEIYPTHTGSFEEILAFWPVAIVNGEEYTGYSGPGYMEENSLCTEYVFDIPENIEFSEFELEIQDCTVVGSESGITVRFADKVYGSQSVECKGVVNGYSITVDEAKILTSVEASKEWHDLTGDMFAEDPGDRVFVKFNIQSNGDFADDNEEFYGFSKVTVNNEKNEECLIFISGEKFDEYSIFPKKDMEEIENIKFLRPTFVLKDAGRMTISL